MITEKELKELGFEKHQQNIYDDDFYELEINFFTLWCAMNEKGYLFTVEVNDNVNHKSAKIKTKQDLINLIEDLKSKSEFME